ncbi:MAG TPA: phage replisome organizer N-terminal domain-containing protein, partial [Massilibacterium sp.]|nr:phage replisome organizer N-terminal domain-containing protein [Massilibacterium sp.]
MSKNKRYYWLKLKEDFFEDDTISWLEEQENGKDYVIFYLKLCLKSLKDEGQLIRYVGERLIPYDVKALAKITNTAPDTVAVAMQAFLDIGLIEHLETGEIYMTQ